MDFDLPEILSHYQGQSQEVIPILQAIQEAQGFLSEETMLEVAKFTGVPESRIYAVATFYAQFRFTPVGKNHIAVCRGTACHVRGAPQILEAIEKTLGIKEGECTKDGQYSLETVACIGCCGLAPCITINDDVKAKLSPKKVIEIFERGQE